MYNRREEKEKKKLCRKFTGAVSKKRENRLLPCSSDNAQNECHLTGNWLYTR
jgi:hypothetical protein